jgi:WD40 repeat protein
MRAFSPAILACPAAIRFLNYWRFAVVKYLRYLCLCLLGISVAANAIAQTELPTGLYDQPVLVVDPEFHTSAILDAASDSAGRYAVTASNDKTLRVWQLGVEPKMLKVLRIPAGPSNIGLPQAVAVNPDGNLIAVAGVTRGVVGQENIYLFTIDGELTKRITGLANVVTALAFSPSGRFLVAGLGGENGIRVYDKESGWSEIARDADYDAFVAGLDFAADSRLATTSADGQLRIYDLKFRLLVNQQLKAGYAAKIIRWHPSGDRFAALMVNNQTSNEVVVYDAASIKPLFTTDPKHPIYQMLELRWSAKGHELYGAGRSSEFRESIVVWSQSGEGVSRKLDSGATNTIQALVPLPNGELLVASHDPHLAVMTSEGKPRWSISRASFDPRGQAHNFSVSADGTIVDFGYENGGHSRGRFDLNNLTLTRNPPADEITAKPLQTGLSISDWEDWRPVRLGTKELEIDPNELARSIAIHPQLSRFALGTDWHLRTFDSNGELIWRKRTPRPAWASNITGDGRLLVAAHDNGIIRWHRLDDGRELLTLYPMLNKRDWVAWTPEGVYAATPGAQGILKWHVNDDKKPWDTAPKAIPVSEIPKTNRPKVLPLIIQEMDHVRALGLAELAEIRLAVKLRTGASVPPGARLHFLSVGVGEYGEHAKHLRLNYAAKDAQDVASALANTQGSLYAAILPQILKNEDATRRGFFRALDAMTFNMQPSQGRDVGVVLFSSHGVLIDGEYYLLPYDVDTRTLSDIKTTAIPVSMLRQSLAKLGEGGRVLVLLDACRSGAITVGGKSLSVDGGQLRAALAGLANVTVLTSSASAKPSFEDPEWKNGAFTEVFLGALGQDGDTDRNGLISITEITDYMARHLPRITAGKGDQTQFPGIEMRFHSELFVSGL